MSITSRHVLWAIFGCAELAACTTPAPTLVPFPIRIEARSTEDDALLPGVEIDRSTSAGGVEALGTTDAEGGLEHMFSLPAGTPLRLVGRCPEGYQLATPPPAMVVFPMVGGADNKVRTRVRCAPEKRSLVVVIHAELEHGLERSDPASGLKVWVDGRERSATSSQGIAHILLEGAPRTSMRVRIDTSGTTLRPENPERSFTIPESSDYVVFSQRFEPRAATSESAGPARRRRRGPRSPSRPTGPVRIP